MDDETLELFKFLTRGKKLKVSSGKLPQGATIQLCANHPVPGSPNHEGKCFKCGCPVYFYEDHPELKKTCIKCWLVYSKSHPTTPCASIDSIVKAGLMRKRN